MSSASGKRKRTIDVSVKKKSKLKISKSSFAVQNAQDSSVPQISTSSSNQNVLQDFQIGSNDQTLDMEWTDAQYISEIHNVNEQLARNVVDLFEQDNTIPFIARYRKNITGGMEAEMLRILKESYDRAKSIKQRASNIIKTIDKLGKWTPDIHAVVKSAKSLNLLEHVYSLFKVPGKRSLAEKARELGLGNVSEDILHGRSLPSIYSLCDATKEGLKSKSQIEDGIKYILADIISKDKSLFDKIQELRKVTFVQIHTTRRKAAKEKKVEVDKNKKGWKKKDEDEDKYEIYYDFKSRVDNIKSHQILAINRGESQKFLSVKIVIPKNFEHDLKGHFMTQYDLSIKASQVHAALLKTSFDYAYKKSIEPALIRRIRIEMNEQAESASIEVFAINLKQLLLTAPIRGKTILGIDPGFKHGCKIAIISEHGDVLKATTIYPHSNSTESYRKASATLSDMVKEYNCSTIALGNGTACRETEVFLTKLIQSGVFKPLDIAYTIVNEAGASIYSCSEEAKGEFLNLDPNLISAVSIARRLQDPLAELVKVEPKHLGVGMYQHDLPEKQLDLTLNEVVVETVSFVGVDINTASFCLLKKVAGLTETRAKNIIQWRKQNRSFTNRKQLLDVKGIGSKTFEQCAGFIRILPETALTNLTSILEKPSLNYLDQTWIHPESYEIAKKLLIDSKCNLINLGTDVFISTINNYAKQGFAKLAKKFKSDETTVEIIIKGLTMRKDDDIRMKYDKPLFRRSLKGIEDLSSGVLLRGEVRNVTHFGTFVDVGVSRDGLIPMKFMKGKILSIGQRVQVKVVAIEKDRNRFSLELIEAF